MNRPGPALVAAALALSPPGAGGVEPPWEVLAPPSVRAPGNESRTLFTALPPAASGVRHINPIDTRHPLKRLYTSAFGGGGVAAGDLDGDGRCDLYFVCGPGPNRLYRNRGDGRFADITAAAGTGGGEAWGGGAALVDIEGDGDLDIYVCNYGAPNQLFLNDGKARFVESGREFGLDLSGAFLMAAFADYDLDGDLDLYLLGHRHYREGGRPNQKVTVLKDGKLQVLPEFERFYGITWRGGKSFEINNVGAPDRLLRNEAGPGAAPVFVDVSREAGISADPDQGNSATWWDFNHDGLPDLYVANDFEFPDRLYRNDGNGTFSDVAADVLPHTAWFSMGADCADIDGDGLMDFLVADMAGTTHYKSKTTMGVMGSSQWFMQNAVPPQYMRNCLFVNTGTGRFLEAAYMAGVASSDWSWAVKFGDLDGDGRADAFIANGMTRSFNNSDNPLDIDALVGRTEWDLYEATPARPEKNLAFCNRGDLAFADVSDAWGLGEVGISYAAAYFDLEGDGDLDLVVANLDAPPSIHRNDGAAGGRLVVKLEAPGANRAAIGASVRVRTADGGVQVRQFNPMRGFSSCDEPLLHFGLGAAEAVESLQVDWPGGGTTTYRDLRAGRRYTLSPEAEGGDGAPAATAPPAAPPPARPLFARTDAARGARHWEMPFDDFRHQPLLPNRLSRLGPGMACGDIDGDGDDDLFLGGCAGYLGQLLVNDGRGRFRRSDFTAAEAHRVSEDLGALFFEADGDGNLDLYVVSGSTEAPPGHPALIDRLYLNDGRGNFQVAPFGAVFADAVSGSVVTAADYDRDGDLDLFVGGRVIPGQYPETPRSRLLQNRGGQFANVAHEVPGLGDAGLVTGALWSDADGDGWVDLLVTTEWGPVKFFRNRRGRLEDRTEAAGLADRTGWWTGVSGGDFDRDGDIDYVVTNFGLNTKYKASPGAPELLYYGDLDGTGRRRLVEAGFEDGVCIPHRGFSCSRRAMPFIGSKLKTYHAFASAGLGDIFDPEKLRGAIRLEANTLASGLLVNDGRGAFKFRPLPRRAQIAPAFGSAVGDFDADGHLDLFLAHNFYSPQLETRPMNGGLSLLLAGDGAGGLVAVPARESGLVVPQDAKSVVAADLQGDGRTDLLIGVNDGPVLAFENRGREAVAPAAAANTTTVTVRLHGPPGNPTGVGARVTAVYPSGEKRVAEVAAGGGYLSQSSPALSFSDPATPPEKIVVRWPDGKATETSTRGHTGLVEVTYE